MYKWQRRGVVVVGFLLLVTSSGWYHFVREEVRQVLTVHVLDVGQGDAVLVVTPEGSELLIDGGRDSSVLRALGRELMWFDRSLTALLATHPDADHIGGLVDVLARYDVRHIYTAGTASDTGVYDSFVREVRNEQAQSVKLQQGYGVALSPEVIVDVLWPLSQYTSSDTNDHSIVTRVRYGDTCFLFTGDASLQVERQLVVVYGKGLDCEVLKVGHHGSKTSTDELFLETVAPDYSVVSAGADNRYGHPHAEVMDRLDQRGGTVLETAREGTVTFHSDGTTVWVE